MGRHGKIQSLPADIRAEVHTRLYNGQGAPDILPWLNGLPEVQAHLAARFAGQPVSDSNLSEFRTGAHAAWVGRKEYLAEVRERVSFAAAAMEDSDKLSKGACGLAGSILLDLIETVESTEPANRDPRAVAGMVDSLVKLRGADTNDERVRVAEARLKQKEEELEFAKQRFQTEFVDGFKKYWEDPAVKEVMERSKDVSNLQTTNTLGAIMFGDRWKGVMPA